MLKRLMTLRTAGLATLLILLSALTAQAEVTRVQIRSRADALGGRAFGSVGPYEVLSGTIEFAVDPANPHNQIIVDVEKAPRDARGRVTFSSDVWVLKPKDATKANGVLFFDVVNRGNKSLLSVFSRAKRATDFTKEDEFGDAWLLKQGYTLVFVGWQFDIAAGKTLVGFTAPIATDNGQPIKGWVRMPFISDEPAASVRYGAEYNTATYLPVNVDDRAYRLTVREGTFAPPRLIPRTAWRFARTEKGAAVPDPAYVTLNGGFKAGLTYELAYETQNPPVAGLGMAAIRDAASAFRYGANQIASGTLAYLYGASQTGRLIRQMIHEGFTIDEQGRKVFDAAFIQTGAVGFGSFNERFAQPNELGPFTQTKFPFLYKTTTDPQTGREDGLGRLIPTGLEPKLFLVDSSSEYWDRGRVAAMRHTSMDGSEDLEDASNVRVYQLAGTKHGAGYFPAAENGGQFKENTNDYRWAQRGLLAALDSWTRNGTEPPPSTHPNLKDGTLVAHKDMRFPALPGLQQPTYVPGGYRADVASPYSAMPFLLPKVDADGNEVSGIRLPIVSVPLATLTGWQFRSARIGSPTTLIAMAGAYIEFPRTKADRERTKDPRPSIAERYGTRAEYTKRVRDAASRLADQRFILREDIDPITEELGAQWDAIMGTPAAAGKTASR
ncbi:MAG: alpha/beta hydrolase domain-containing protein [Vicinamibacterales bacterium]